jgi:TonB family protein
MNPAAKFSSLRDHLPEATFSQMIWASVALHIAIVLAFTIRTYFFPDDAIDIQSAIRVDIVDLPDKGQQIPKPAPVEVANPEPPKPQAMPDKPKEAAPEKPKVDLKAKKKEQKDALDKIKAMQALENISEEVKADEEKSKQKNTKVKGNVESKGEFLKGIQSNQMSTYIDQLKRLAQEHWNLPKWMADLELKATALVFLDENGAVTRRLIEKSSGNSTFDEMVLNSIDQGSPFPPPPKHFVDLFKVKGIRLGFPE